MRVEKVVVKGVGRIDDLELELHPQMNILCGPNGIGKTTVLECIAHSFSTGGTAVLKRHALHLESTIEVAFEFEGQKDRATLRFNEFEPGRETNVSGRHALAKHIFSLKTTRTFGYVALDAVGRDQRKEQHHFWAEASHGVQFADLKNWFVNRFLYSAHKGALTKTQIQNLKLAKRCFSLLDSEFTFSTVDASTNEILVDTPNGRIYYEYLSSGFKSTLAILFAVIKEVELRFGHSNMAAEAFDGVVLIDEIELHLHPAWQQRVVTILKRTFPKTQFVVSTHSPHVLQAAAPEEIIALEQQHGKVAVRSAGASKFGLRGWTVDEILTDVMGMVSTRSEDFTRALEDFEAALRSESGKEARAAYARLDDLLHPSSELRKLLRLQLASLEGE